MIRLESLTYTYPVRETSHTGALQSQGTPIFQDFNWEVQRGESWAVLGPSGCGKTTLLILLAGLRFPSAGRILIDGQLLTRPRPHTGLILQDYGLLPWATVSQNAELGIKVRSFYGPDGTHTPLDFKPGRDVEPWLERLGLTPVRDKYPGQLSGGQRQRTAIARTLALRPDLLLMDEPFSSLDAPTREGLQNLIRQIWSEQELTLVVVTHAIEEAALLGQNILLLGQPPNTNALVFKNSGFDQPDYRESSQYKDLCRELRRQMEPL
jgi:ABC-type nitrate/sulfonate/bicarbonate transport system ATPase subunit